MTNEYKVIGIYTLSNWGGIEVLEINHDDDTVLWRYSEFAEVKESVIEYCVENEDGNELDGFYADGNFIDFGSIMRVRN